VRHDPKGVDNGGMAELTEGGGGTMARRCEDGATAAVRSAGVDMRPRKRGGGLGDGVLGRTLTREDKRERKEWCGGDGHAL
jgi:hypothetical protein